MTEPLAKSALVEPCAGDHHDLLIDELVPLIRRALERAGPGQRLRVMTLPSEVAEGICRKLHGAGLWSVRRLVSARGSEGWHASATKLIELRNSLEEPLLVFVPPDLRTAAEDSLDIATFNEIAMTTTTSNMVKSLLLRIDQALREDIAEELVFLRSGGHIRNADEEVEYLLTVVKNGGSRVAAGGAIYALGLIPDFELFRRGDTRRWLTRNLQMCKGLGDSSQPLQTRILKLPLRPGSLQQDLFRFLRSRAGQSVGTWAREIALREEFSGLAFERWEFSDSDSKNLRLILEPLMLPRQTEDQIGGNLPLPVLNLQGGEPLKASFRSIPQPSMHASWKSYRIQVLSVAGDGNQVVWESNSFLKPQSKQNRKVSRSIKLADLESLEEGTYFLKVEAFDSDGAVLTTPERIDPRNPASRAENESESFLVVRETVPVIEHDVRSVFVRSLLDAWMRNTATALGGKSKEEVFPRREVTGSWREPVGAAPRGMAHFELGPEPFAGFTVVVPALLRRIELEILENPAQLGMNTLSFVDARTPADVELERRDRYMLPEGTLADRFLAARKSVFDAILNHHLREPKPGEPKPGAEEIAHRKGIAETVDLSNHAVLIEEYARAFMDLVNWVAIGSEGGQERSSIVRALAHLDAVELRWRRSPGDPGRALIVSPTHPVRLLWHARHTAFCEKASQSWKDGEEKVSSWREFFEEIREGFLPINLPMVLFDRHMRGCVERTPLTEFWPLYLPDRTDGGSQIDSAKMRDRVLQQIGIRDRAISLSLVPPAEIAARLYTYVLQHPYVEQLRLNVFNPGDASLIADVLRELERVRRQEQNPLPLRYSVHLFSPGEHLDSDGDSLESLLDPDRQVGENDEFSLAASNHLLPKLVFSRNSFLDFVSQSHAFPAHVSLVFENFLVNSRVAPIGGLRRGSFVSGLVQEPETQIERTGPHFGWLKGLRPSARPSARAGDPTAAGREQETLLCNSLMAAQSVQASFALGNVVSPELAPVASLQLDAASQALLKQIHDVSDWVLTIDRNLGLDFFDSPSDGKEVGYLLDYAPEYLQEDRQRVLLTTRCSVELEKLTRPVMEQHGLNLASGDEAVVLETLRSLSGRLALRLESARNQAAEIVGLLLARWLLEEVGLLEERIVVPLDAHRSLFSSEGGELGSGRRADLLLVGFEEPATLRLDVVEVKLREELPGAARPLLYKEMREQTEATVDRIRSRFAWDLYSQPRADRLLRAKELAGLLSFYIRRAQRYGLMSTEAARAGLDFAGSLDLGYSLDLRTLGVVFEEKGSGSHIDEEEPGFTVYRFGGAKAKELLERAVLRYRKRVHAAEPEEPGSGEPGPGEQGPSGAPPSPPADPQVESFRSTLSVRASRRSHLTPLIESIGTKLEPSQQAGGQTLDPEAADSVQLNQRANEDPVPELEKRREDLVLLGANEFTPQWGILGKSGSHEVAMDLNGCNTISLFGVQGFGKSYTLGVISEMASLAVEGINTIPSPLATVIFHYHKSDAYAPEYASATEPNRKVTEVERLLSEYGARPKGLSDVVILSPEAKLMERRREFPGLTVEPIKFSSSELGAESWKFLLGAYGNDSLYVRQLVAIMRRHRSGLTLDVFRKELSEIELPKTSARFAEDRLNLAAPYIDDSRRLGEILRPGRTVIIDLRDEWIEKDEALGLFVVMLRIFAAAKHEAKDFNKLVVFDEAHKYITESDLIGQVVETIREMRHQATSVVIASQDPLSVPRAVIELTSILVLHRMTSPQWLRHLKTAIAALETLSDQQTAALKPGEALVWAQRSTDTRFVSRPQKIKIRPRFTQHGGGTKTAVEGATVR